MGLFDKYKEPVFLKEGSFAQEQRRQLQEIATSATGDLKIEIDREIGLLTLEFMAKITLLLNCATAIFL